MTGTRFECTTGLSINISLNKGTSSKPFANVDGTHSLNDLQRYQPPGVQYPAANLLRNIRGYGWYQPAAAVLPLRDKKSSKIVSVSFHSTEGSSVRKFRVILSGPCGETQ